MSRGAAELSHAHVGRLDDHAIGGAMRRQPRQSTPLRRLLLGADGSQGGAGGRAWFPLRCWCPLHVVPFTRTPANAVKLLGIDDFEHLFPLACVRWLLAYPTSRVVV